MRYLIIMLIFAAAPLRGQMLPGGGVDDNYKKKEPDKITGLKGSYYFCGAVKAAQQINTVGIEFGVRAGAALTESFGIGGGFYSLISKNVDIEVPELEKEQPFLRNAYGGIDGEFFIAAGEKMHLSLILLAGLGFSSYSNYNSIDIESDLNGDWYAVTELSLNYDLHITQRLWISAGAGYRLANAVDYKNINDGDLSGFQVSLAFRTFF